MNDDKRDGALEMVKLLKDYLRKIAINDPWDRLEALWLVEEADEFLAAALKAP